MTRQQYGELLVRREELEKSEKSLRDGLVRSGDAFKKFAAALEHPDQLWFANPPTQFAYRSDRMPTPGFGAPVPAGGPKRFEWDEVSLEKLVLRLLEFHKVLDEREGVERDIKVGAKDVGLA
jgi:hypothetical protein